MAIKARLASDEQGEQEPVDQVFFPNDSIKVGTKLVNYGRRDPGSEWVVTAIFTYVRRPSGNYDMEKTQGVIHLNDLISLRRMGEGLVGQPTTRRPTFGALKYSAIWRLS